MPLQSQPAPSDLSSQSQLSNTAEISNIHNQNPEANCWFIWITTVSNGTMICEGNRSPIHHTRYFIGNNSVRSTSYTGVFFKQCTGFHSVLIYICAIFGPWFFSSQTLFKCHLFYPYNYFTQSQQQYHVLYIPCLSMNTPQILTEG